MTGKPDIRCFVEDMNAYLRVSDVAQKKKTVIYSVIFTFHFMSFVAFCFSFCNFSYFAQAFFCYYVI